jgi:plasmid stability protein
MANVTITLDDGMLREARIRAVAEGSSFQSVVRSLVAEWLRRDAAQEEAVAAIRGLLDAEEYDSGGVPWSREELYEGMLR